MVSPSSRALVEQFKHDRREVGRQHPRAETRRGNAKGTAACRYVEEAHGRPKTGATQTFAPEPRMRGRDDPIITGRDLVPGTPGIFALASAHVFSSVTARLIQV
jgi:hypothetical protein